MSILKEGLLLKNNLLFKRTEKSYYCSLCFGNWIPTLTNSENIFSSEVLDTRVIPSITVGWDDGLGSDFVNIEFNVSYPQTVTFNRLVLYYGGHQRSKYNINFNGFNSVEIQIPSVENPFLNEDRVLINGSFYKIISVLDNNLGLEPLGDSPVLPFSGSSTLRDASGIPLVASQLNDVFQISNGDNISFIMNGTSN